jgi:hypothetical protein
VSSKPGVIHSLIAQIKQKSLRIKPTTHDVALAQDDFDIEQKCINLAYKKNLKWATLRKRNTNF